MARAMNVSKRVSAAKSIVARTQTNAKRAEKMAKELTDSFGKSREPQGKVARDLAKELVRLGANLKIVHSKFAKAF